MFLITWAFIYQSTHAIVNQYYLMSILVVIDKLASLIKLQVYWLAFSFYEGIGTFIGSTT